MTNYELLKSVPLFSELEDDIIKALAARATIRECESDELLVCQQEASEAFYIVLSGRLKIFRSNTEGREQIFALVENGQPVCFCTAYTDKAYPVSVTALQTSCVAEIPITELEALGRDHPGFLLRMLQALTNRLLETMDLLESLSLQGVPKRVSHFLMHSEACLATHPGEPFKLPVTFRELSKIVGTTPETLSRIMHRMKRDHLIEANGKTIRILDKTRLFENTP